MQGARVRHHHRASFHASAAYSPCGAFRYSLSRRWGSAPAVAFIMLNPSTASEAQDDPTIARCAAIARALGAGGITVVNLFALRATDPRVLRDAPEPVGPLNDAAILSACSGASRVICAWGTHGAHLGRDAQVASGLTF